VGKTALVRITSLRRPSTKKYQGGGAKKGKKSLVRVTEGKKVRVGAVSGCRSRQGIFRRKLETFRTRANALAGNRNGRRLRTKEEGEIEKGEDKRKIQVGKATGGEVLAMKREGIGGGEGVP